MSSVCVCLCVCVRGGGKFQSTHFGCWVFEDAGEEGRGRVWGAGTIREIGKPVGECCVPVKRLEANTMSGQVRVTVL